MVKHLRFYILLLSVCFSGIVEAQLVFPLGNVVSNGEIVSDEFEVDDNENIYSFTSDFRAQESYLHRYDGLVWSRSKSSRLLQHVSKIEEYKGQVYITGTQVQGYDLRRWNNSNWEYLRLSLGRKSYGDSLPELVKHGDELLFICSDVDSINGNYIGGVGSNFGDTVWQKASINLPFVVRKAYSKFDTLYVMGGRNFQERNLYKYVNRKAVDTIKGVQFIKATNSYFIFSQGDEMYRNDGTSTDRYSDSLAKEQIQTVYDIVDYNGLIVLHCRKQNEVVVYIPDLKESLTLPAYFKLNVATVGHGVYVSPYREDGKTVSHKIARIKVGYSSFKGRVYYDLNANCLYDTNDYLMENHPLHFGEFNAFSNSFGLYNFAVPAGFKDSIHTIEINHFTRSCVFSKTITTSKDEEYNQDIVYQPILDRPDLAIKITGERAVQGRKSTYAIEVANVGTSNYGEVNLALYFDDRLSDFASTFPHTISQDTVYFKLTALPMFGKQYIPFEVVSNHTNLDIGDSVFFAARLLQNDFDSTNNEYLLEQVVSSAYDPNKKVCSPDGLVKEKVKKISFIIHFQNTGTDTAYKVTVVDTIDRRLPISKVKVTGTSHPSVYSLKVEGNTLIWTFENILLPDSGTNFSGSKGYIYYETYFKNEMTIGDTIENRAHIYFDYQSPIITNTTVLIKGKDTVIIPEPTDALVSVYPNPAAEFIVVRNQNNEPITFGLYDMSGRKVLDEKVNPMEERTIKTLNISRGIYLMRSEQGYIGKLIKY